MASSGTSQQQVLNLLIDRKAGATVDELVNEVGLSRTAVNQHLISLEKDGYVRKGVSRKTRGRPQHVYLLTEEGTARLIPNSPERLRARALRAFAHGEMKNACEQIAKSSNVLLDLFVAPLEAELKTVAEVFVELQQQRHLADYDLSQSFNRIKVVGIVAKANSAIAAWSRIRNSPNANVFLAALLLNNRWNK